MKSLRRDGGVGLYYGVLLVFLMFMVLAVGVLADMLPAVVVLAVCCGMRRTDDERHG